MVTVKRRLPVSKRYGPFLLRISLSCVQSSAFWQERLTHTPSIGQCSSLCAHSPAFYSFSRTCILGQNGNGENHVNGTVNAVLAIKMDGNVFFTSTVYCVIVLLVVNLTSLHQRNRNHTPYCASSCKHLQDIKA